MSVPRLSYKTTIKYQKNVFKIDLLLPGAVFEQTQPNVDEVNVYRRMILKDTCVCYR